MTAQLRHKPSTRSQRTRHTRQHIIRPPHPVQRSIRNYGIELPVKRQRLAIHPPRIHTIRHCRRHQARRTIHANHARSALRHRQRKHTIAASQVENVLTGLRLQPLNQWRTKLRHKARIPRVPRRIPALLTHNLIYG